MTANAVPITCSILRGGTSRAVFFRVGDLPAVRAQIEPILLDVFGSPDVRQISGLGGATSQTSKAAIIGPPSRPDADIDYTFAQVSVTAPLVDWGGNCGNISSAVGPFAIDAGLVAAVEPVTTVRIHNTNTGKLIVARVPVAAGRARIDGPYEIPGVPGQAARIDLEFGDPAGSISGALLPTGRPLDVVELSDGRQIELSLVDAGNPVVFLRAEDLGFDGTESPAEIEDRTDATAILEEVRSIAAEWLGLVDDRRLATDRSPGLPKVGFVASPRPYTTSTGRPIDADAIDLSGRLMSMQTAHRSYMVTGAIATAAAACTPGTIPNEAARPARERPDGATLRIAHPYGVMDAVVALEGQGHDRPDPGGVAPSIAAITVGRTARHILDGQVWVPGRLLDPSDATDTGSDRRTEPVAAGATADQ